MINSILVEHYQEGKYTVPTEIIQDVFDELLEMRKAMTLLATLVPQLAKMPNRPMYVAQQIHKRIREQQDLLIQIRDDAFDNFAVSFELRSLIQDVI